jgi:hypothetical protein
VKRVNEIGKFGNNPNIGHIKALQQAVNRLSTALERVKRSCLTLAAAAAAVAAAEAAIEAAAPFLIVAAAIPSGPTSDPSAPSAPTGALVVQPVTGGPGLKHVQPIPMESFAMKQTGLRVIR